MLAPADPDGEHAGAVVALMELAETTEAAAAAAAAAEAAAAAAAEAASPEAEAGQEPAAADVKPRRSRGETLITTLLCRSGRSGTQLVPFRTRHSRRPRSTVGIRGSKSRTGT